MIYGILVGIFLFNLFMVASVILYIVEGRIHDTMSIREEQKIIKLFKNGIIEYFEERIKMKKLENKLNRIEEDF